MHLLRKPDIFQLHLICTGNKETYNSDDIYVCKNHGIQFQTNFISIHTFSKNHPFVVLIFHILLPVLVNNHIKFHQKITANSVFH